MKPDALESKVLPLFVLVVSVIAVLMSIPVIIAFTNQPKSQSGLQLYPQTTPLQNDFSNVQDKAKDAETKTDLKALMSQLEAYYAGNGSYPSQTNVYSDSWRTENFKGYDPQAAIAPNGDTLGSAKGYDYEPNPSGCQGTTADPCTSYILSGTLQDGSPELEYSLNY